MNLYPLAKDIIKRSGKENEKEVYLKIKNDPFMDLVIERHFMGNDEYLSVSHYFEQNGDLIPDPDVLFVNGVPVELSQVLAYTRVNSRNRKEVESFLRMWARNIKEQGFLEKVGKSNIDC